MRLVLALAAGLMLAGCASGTPLPTPPTGEVPDLLGTWRGTWGGEPLVLLVTGQHEDTGYSGVFVGGAQIFGQRRPGISGVLTSTIRGAAVSSRAAGWFGRDATGRQVLLIQTDTPDGGQRLTLARVSESQLQGMGESDFRWGPKGPAQLTRQPR
jgi:hypothetical protein